MKLNALTLFVAGLAVSGLQATPIIVNGSLTGAIANAALPAGWTILAGSPDTMDQNNNVGMPDAGTFVAAPSGPSPNGGTWVGFARDGSSFIESFGQTVTGFTPGAQYVVSWDFGNFGYYLGYGGDQGIEVLLDGVSVGSSSLLPVGPNWTAQSLTFMATAPVHQLQFQPVSGNRSYISIDGISLADASPVPEPASSALLAAGLAALAFWGKKCRH